MTIDLNPRSILAEHFVALIDDAMSRHQDRRRDYLGASGIGEPCPRRLQYEYLGTPIDEGAGFTLRTRGKDGSQFAFEDCDGRFKGHVDGVITGGPDGFKYPALFECKVLGAKGFGQLVKHGVAKAYPKYAAQVATYQAYLKLADNPAFFVALNADDMSLHLELVRFDPALAQECADKAARILTACDHGEQLPRITDSADSFACRFCAFKGRCWDE